jgi:hypothetical protein
MKEPNYYGQQILATEAPLPVNTEHQFTKCTIMSLILNKLHATNVTNCTRTINQPIEIITHAPNRIKQTVFQNNQKIQNHI